MNTSEKNLEIIRKMIDREGMMLQNFVEDLLKLGYENTDFPSYDDLENFYVAEIAGECYTSQEDIDARIEEIEETHPDIEFNCHYDEDQLNVDFSKEEREAYQEHIELQDAELEPAEVFQWFCTSDWMADKLAEAGEVVLRWGNNVWWGRQACGMAIYYDGCFHQIAKDMEILEGMKYEWSV